MRVSARKLMLLVVGPLVFDMLLAMFSFWLNITAVRMGVPPRTQAWIGALFAVGYTASARLAGAWATPSRSSAILGGTIVLFPLVGMLCLFVSWFPLFLAVAFMLGALSAHYFVSFQVKLGRVRPFRSLAQNLALYNVSWGTGYALGPFVGGWIRGKSSMWMIGTSVGITALHGALLMAADRKHARTGGDNGAGEIEGRRSTPLERRMGWMTAFCSAIICTGTAATLWPALGGLRGLSDLQIGLGLMTLGLAIPISSVIWAAWPNAILSYRSLRSLILAQAAVFPLLLLTPSWPAEMLCLFAIGFLHSGMIFYAVYCGNADPDSPARSVGMNEAVIGMGSGAGPLLLGGLAWDNAASCRPYLGGLILMVAAAIGIAALRRGAATRPDSETGAR